MKLFVGIVTLSRVLFNSSCSWVKITSFPLAFDPNPGKLNIDVLNNGNVSGYSRFRIEKIRSSISKSKNNVNVTVCLNIIKIGHKKFSTYSKVFILSLNHQ